MSEQEINKRKKLASLVKEIQDERQITRRIQRKLTAIVFSCEWLGEAERNLINHLFNQIQMGFIRIVD